MSTTYFHIGNYRRFSELQVVPLKPITLVYGNNSAGKSALLEARRAWRKIAASGSLKSLDQVDSIHSFDKIVRDRNRSYSVTLGESYDDNVGLSISFRLINDAVKPVRYDLYYDHIHLFTLERKTVSRRVPSIRLDDSDTAAASPQLSTMPRDEFILTIDNDGKLGNALAALRRSLASTEDGFDEGYDDIAYLLTKYENSSLLSSMRRTTFLLDDYFDRNSIVLTSWTMNDIDGDDFRQLAAKDISDPMLSTVTSPESLDVHGPQLAAALFVRALANIRKHPTPIHLGPMRIRPSRQLDPSIDYGEEWSRGGGEQYKQLRSSKHTRDSVNQWLSKAGEPFSSYHFDVITLIDQDHARAVELRSHDGVSYSNSDVDLENVYHESRLLLIDRRRNIHVGLSEVGTGISQVVPVLVLCASSVSDVVERLTHSRREIHIEQPELHLHPKLQAALGDAILWSTLPGNLAFIETHSEHLLLGLQRIVAAEEKDDDGKQEKIQILFVDNSGGAPAVIPLNLSKRGILSRPWPGGFFDENYDPFS